MPIPNDLRLMNRRQLLLASLKSGSTTRSDLAKLTGISAPTTGKIIEELIDDGILRLADVPAAQARPGRPGQYVKVDDVQPRYLGIHVGTRNTHIAALAVAPMLSDVWAKVIPTQGPLTAWRDAVVQVATPLLRCKPAGVLVSSAGVLDSNGQTLADPDLQWTETQSISGSLSQALDLPAFAVRSADALALGHRAVNPSADNFLIVDFGASVQIAAVIRGELFHGAHPFAYDLGHMPVLGQTTLCACGNRGCLNTLVGRRAMFKGSSAGRGSAGTFDPDAETLYPAEAAVLQNADVIPRVRAALAAAGSMIASVINPLGLSHVVITGFVADLPVSLFEELRQAIVAAGVGSRFGVVRVDAAPRHRLAGLACYGIDRLIAPVQ
ncbi:MAG: ROK family protein [Tepidisphaeraceae bacterium]